MSSISNLTTFTNFLDRNSHVVVQGGVLCKASWAQRIKMHFSYAYRTQQEAAIVAIAARLLQAASRPTTPRKAFKGRDVYILRRWMSQHKKAGTELLKKEFKTEFTAYRLGITANNLNASVGLEQFAETKALYNYIAKYRHTLKVADENSPVQILMDNKYVDWSEAKAAVADQPDVPGGQWPWKYTKSGIKNADLGIWTKADLKERSFQRDKYKVTDQYLFSYCVFSSSKGPRYTGDHAWIRLITPKGKIYEFGKYRPPGMGGGSSALLNFPADLHCPELSVFWPTPPKDKRRRNNPPLKNTDGTRITKINFAITKETFKKARAKIVELQNEKKLSFGLFDNSCVVLGNQIAELCGIKIDTSASVIKLHLSPFLMRLVDRITKYIPNIILKMIYYIPGVITNIVTGFVMGGFKASQDGSRYISNIWDLLNANKSFLHHPWYLGTEIKRKVEESRPADNPKYGIPAQFKV